MEVADSARKHGLSDEEILHAARNPVAIIAVSTDRVFLIGTALNGQLLEIVVVEPDENPAIIHADVCRQKFYRYL